MDKLNSITQKWTSLFKYIQMQKERILFSTLQIIKLIFNVSIENSKQAESDVPMIRYYWHSESIKLTIHLPLSTASLKACFMEAMLKAGLNLKKVHTHAALWTLALHHHYLANLLIVQWHLYYIA